MDKGDSTRGGGWGIAVFYKAMMEDIQNIDIGAKT